ncbi:hypothetical protein EVAR_51542_1 [Eumeta japonica]|uniref:Uncharacterized protein n=1 Tax=Eumeta variegata TaxID=151549 RepID=A0A4C1XF93_EUMVA|nr:hypothetical protein EVAR_51542_1 [Eumeta japonica]
MEGAIDPDWKTEIRQFGTILEHSAGDCSEGQNYTCPLGRRGAGAPRRASPATRVSMGGDRDCRNLFYFGGYELSPVRRSGVADDRDRRLRVAGEWFSRA